MGVNVIESGIFDINGYVLPGLELLLGFFDFACQLGNLGLGGCNLFL